MNYRHIYHAGNFADVVKHLCLVLVLESLRGKDKPFFTLDTHAGIGLYDLTSEQAQKTKEYEGGIGKLWTASDLPPVFDGYMRAVRACNGDGALRRYPGSPLIVRALLRPQDRLVANELHPEDAASLRKSLVRDAGLRIESRDGYECLRALLPPPERRGLVLIDPPFEEPDEFGRLLRGLADGHKRFATGIYMLWYPVKNRAETAAFHAALKRSGIPKITAAEFYRRPPDDPAVFSGTGLVLVNPPFGLAEKLEQALPYLVSALTMGAGFWRIEELTGE